MVTATTRSKSTKGTLRWMGVSVHPVVDATQDVSAQAGKVHKGTPYAKAGQHGDEGPEAHGHHRHAGRERRLKQSNLLVKGKAQRERAPEKTFRNLSSKAT